MNEQTIDERIKKAEARAYARGYSAGRAKNVKVRKEIAREEAFWQRAFLSALPACIRAEGWTRGEENIRSLDQRVRLAADAAAHAVSEARNRGRL